ncbi:MAG TPA: diguanylate cyclase [Chloroflexi bacterium]|nr:MAG: GGDEF domain-containing protein [Chloroflexota bacterium]HDD54966.1 diguanylate cyclase [Chloroflexota bacterium]
MLQNRWGFFYLESKEFMRHFISKIGQIRTVALLSALTIAIALASTLAFTVLVIKLNVELNLNTVLLISVLVTLTIAPMMSWFIVGLFLKVDRLEAEMRLLATYDSLTGLLTRREFLERANYFHKVALREGLPYALIIADLDNFKEINDHFGHLTGDQTLEFFGEAILANLRESDLACRFGGDEFLFFLPNTSRDQAQQFGDRLHSVITETIDCSDLEIDLSISLGIACYPGIPAENVKDLISAADNAMYQAKRSGGNKTQHYSLASIQ